MAGIAIMGYGTIGSGVAAALRGNAKAIERKAGERVELRRILDILDFQGSPDASLVTHDVDDIMRDSSVSIVVETMGGTGIAYEFTKLALSSRKHVVTSNKDLVAEHGPELLKLAHMHGVRYLFEASVGGGMPILHPIERCLAANRIIALSGIVNGTTNHMLTYMHERGSDYETTLKEAQRLGITEKDPRSDVEGLDAARKLAILASAAFGSFVDWKIIPARGITSVTDTDIRHASELGCAIKLVASARLALSGGPQAGVAEKKLLASVAPAFVKRGHAFYGVNGAYNAVSVTGDLVGDVLFCGIGAGKLPTASAVIADIIDIVRGNGYRGDGANWGNGSGSNGDSGSSRGDGSGSNGDGGSSRGDGACVRHGVPDAVWNRDCALTPEPDDSDPALAEPGLFYARIEPVGAGGDPGTTPDCEVEVDSTPGLKPDSRKRLVDALYRSLPDASMFPDNEGGQLGQHPICFTAKAGSEAAFLKGLSAALADAGVDRASRGRHCFAVGAHMRIIDDA